MRRSEAPQIPSDRLGGVEKMVVGMFLYAQIVGELES